MMEFHVSRQARDRYQFDQSIYRFNGNVIFADFLAARRFSQRMNDKRDLLRYPEQAVQASQINGMGLIDEVLHLLISTYRREVNANILKDVMVALQEELGEEALQKTLYQFSQDFPPSQVYRQEQTLEDYLAGSTEGLTHWEVALEEMMMLWLANMNPAFAPYRELFDDTGLEKQTAYRAVMAGLTSYFDDQPGLTSIGSGGESLIDLLRAPALASPHSITGQLEYVRRRWSGALGSFLYRLLSSIDFISEENKPVFWGPGPIEAIEFGVQAVEPEHYSPDMDWMPRVVMLARNAYVWLDQLSKEYERPIDTLNQVPDEELDRLAGRGITGLWLIGLWERSKASKRIKQVMGNPEAVASAYSLHDYEIASDLGGRDAMADLRARAWQRGIRMASDMVPNHMAIDSRWVIQHPDWFLSLPYSPFPAYTFNGPDLCDDERVGVYLEDGYYARSDAAVVFKRVDHWSGDTRYIYHGNDGTNMPWNDTAQLDYLQAEVREAVIQTILHVARQFPIIRFDAAMTLAKKHVQRLWFPEPGTGGDIASRSEYGLTRADFDAAMPNEFWREVVDRVAEEAPDTLLLAEAFWLLEGYFVRTLGMHRVYNSAFMHMLRDEDNDKYRQLIKNTIEFDPEILKRYVNFMSNPDEETAIAQFSDGDKYFGVTTVMSTVPGLPMFGHGQFEGYAEKYGMEYRRAYWDEQPNQWLIDRHLREIVPLLKRRYLFAEVRNFRLYDFFAGDQVDENVLAYSNRAGGERSLVLYHNHFGDTHGWIKTSAAYIDKENAEQGLIHTQLGDGLALSNDPNTFVMFRDLVSGLEYIRNSRQMHESGLYVALGAYQRYVYLDFREVADNEYGHYRQLHDYLGGRGVPSVEDAVTEIFLTPLLQPYRDLVAAETLKWTVAARMFEADVDIEVWEEAEQEGLAAIETSLIALLEQVQAYAGVKDDEKELELAEVEVVAEGILQELRTTLLLPALMAGAAESVDAEIEKAMAYYQLGFEENSGTWYSLMAFVFTHSLAKVAVAQGAAAQARSWLDEWLLGKLLQSSLLDSGLGEEEAWRVTALTKILVAHQDQLAADTVVDALEEILAPTRSYRILNNLLRDSEVQQFLQINRYGGELWYNREALHALLHGLFAAAAVNQLAGADEEQAAETITSLNQIVTSLLQADKSSEYRVDQLLEEAKG